MLMQQLLSKLLSGSNRISTKLLQQYLMQDPYYYEDLCPLAHKTMVFRVEAVPLKMCMHFTPTRVQITYCERTEQVDYDLEVRGDLDALVQFMLQADARSSLLSQHRVNYTGELLLLEALAHLLRARNFSQGPLAETGVARLLSQAANRTVHNKREQIRALRKTSVDYLQEELKVLPSARHFLLTQQDLLNLAERLDRLEAKIKLLA